MDNKIQNWDYNQFLGFLLLYCSSADYKVTEEEKKYIDSKTNHEDLKEVKEVFDKQNDYEIVQTIMSFREKYFNTKESKDEIIKDIKELFLSDKDFSLNEKIICEPISNLLKM